MILSISCGQSVFFFKKKGVKKRWKSDCVNSGKGYSIKDFVG